MCKIWTPLYPWCGYYVIIFIGRYTMGTHGGYPPPWNWHPDPQGSVSTGDPDLWVMVPTGIPTDIPVSTCHWPGLVPSPRRVPAALQEWIWSHRKRAKRWWARYVPDPWNMYQNVRKVTQKRIDQLQAQSLRKRAANRCLACFARRTHVSKRQSLLSHDLAVHIETLLQLTRLIGLKTVLLQHKDLLRCVLHVLHVFHHAFVDRFAFDTFYSTSTTVTMRPHRSNWSTSVYPT